MFFLFFRLLTAHTLKPIASKGYVDQNFVSTSKVHTLYMLQTVHTVSVQESNHTGYIFTGTLDGAEYVTITVGDIKTNHSLQVESSEELNGWTLRKFSLSDSPQKLNEWSNGHGAVVELVGSDEVGIPVDSYRLGIMMVAGRDTIAVLADVDRKRDRMDFTVSDAVDIPIKSDKLEDFEGLLDSGYVLELSVNGLPGDEGVVHSIVLKYCELDEVEYSCSTSELSILGSPVVQAVVNRADGMVSLISSTGTSTTVSVLKGRAVLEDKLALASSVQGSISSLADSVNKAYRKADDLAFGSDTIALLANLTKYAVSYEDPTDESTKVARQRDLFENKYEVVE